MIGCAQPGRSHRTCAGEFIHNEFFCQRCNILPFAIYYRAPCYGRSVIHIMALSNRATVALPLVRDSRDSESVDSDSVQVAVGKRVCRCQVKSSASDPASGAAPKMADSEVGELPVARTQSCRR